MTKVTWTNVQGKQFLVSGFQFQPPIIGAFPSKPETRNRKPETGNRELETARYQPLRSLSEVM
jgi:hypothetical protein